MRQQADFAQAEGRQDLGADAVVAQVVADAFRRPGLAEQRLLHAAVLLHVDDDAMAGLGHMREGGHEGMMAVHARRVENIAQEVLGVHPHEGRRGVERALGEGQVMAPVHLAAENMELELAVFRGERPRGHAFDQLLALVAVFDQRRDGDERHLVALLEFHELRQPGHRAVLTEDFADDGGRLESGQGREVDGGLGVAGALKHAARPRAKREDVARLHEFVGLGGGIGQQRDGAGAVEGADAGRDALGGVDGHGEGRAERLTVLLDHGIDAQAL